MSILIYEKKDHIARITLNRPPLNTMSVELSRQLIKALHDYDADNDLQ